VNLEEFWQKKSDRELESAAREIAEYTEEAQQVIRAEMKKRALPEPPAFTRTPPQREPSLMGNQLEKLRLEDGPGRDDWVRWIIGIPLALILGLLLLASSVNSPRNLIIGAAIVGGVIWSIFKAIEDRNCHLSLHEKGVVYERPNQKQSAYYDELQIWQTITQINVALAPIRTTHLYTLQFPSGDRVNTTQELIGEKIQRMIAQYQLPRMIETYNQGYSVQMGSLCLDQKGITVDGERTPWSDVSHIDVLKGVMYVYKSGSQMAIARTPISDIPNLYALLNFLEQLGHYRPQEIAPQ
jgi:hypothetical protein